MRTDSIINSNATIRGIQGVALLLALAWAGTILWINGVPAEDLPRVGWSSRIPHFDKIVHFGLYAILGGLIWMATAFGCRVGGRAWLAFSALSMLIPVVGGALDEWRQSFVPGRSASVLDWMADASGGVVAVLTLALLHRWLVGRSSAEQRVARDGEDDLRAGPYRTEKVARDL